MTWIRVIPFDEDETLRRAREAQQSLYPVEYATADTPAAQASTKVSWRRTRSFPTRSITRSRPSAR